MQRAPPTNIEMHNSSNNTLEKTELQTNKNARHLLAVNNRLFLVLRVKGKKPSVLEVKKLPTNVM